MVLICLLFQLASLSFLSFRFIKVLASPLALSLRRLFAAAVGSLLLLINSAVDFVRNLIHLRVLQEIRSHYCPDLACKI